MTIEYNGTTGRYICENCGASTPWKSMIIDGVYRMMIDADWQQRDESRCMVCPFCGEQLEVLIDGLGYTGQTTIEGK